MAQNRRPPGSNGQPARLTEWVLTGRLRPDTINVVELVATRLLMEPTRRTVLDRKEVVLGQMPWVGNVHPQAWFDKLNVAVTTAASTTNRLTGQDCRIDGPSFQTVAEDVVREVSKKLKGAMINAQGQRVIRTEPDGAILAVNPQEVVPEGQAAEGPGLTLPSDVLAEAEAAANSGPEGAPVGEDQPEAPSESDPEEIGLEPRAPLRLVRPGDPPIPPADRPGIIL